MKIEVEIYKVTGGYHIEIAENELQAVAATVKQAAKRAGELIEAALGEEK